MTPTIDDLKERLWDWIRKFRDDEENEARRKEFEASICPNCEKECLLHIGSPPRSTDGVNARLQLSHYIPKEATGEYDRLKDYPVAPFSEREKKFAAVMSELLDIQRIASNCLSGVPLRTGGVKLAIPEDIEAPDKQDAMASVKGSEGVVESSGEVSAPVEIPAGGEAADKDKKKQRRGQVTQKEAAALCGVSRRTVQKWDSGQNPPSGYPGREDAVIFRQFAERHQANRRNMNFARSVEHAISMDPSDLDSGERRNAWGDDD